LSSIFTRIIKGEIEAYVIAEDEFCIAFLDVFPLVKGHVLVVPKVEVDNVFNLDNETFSKLHLFSKKISKAVEKAIPCERIGVAIIGLEVPHAHIHLVPLIKVEDINFSKPKIQVGDFEMKEIQQAIRFNL
jgi:histidine triad (HIT) family protein